MHTNCLCALCSSRIKTSNSKLLPFSFDNFIVGKLDGIWERTSINNQNSLLKDGMASFSHLLKVCTGCVAQQRCYDLLFACIWRLQTMFRRQPSVAKWRVWKQSSGWLWPAFARHQSHRPSLLSQETRPSLLLDWLLCYLVAFKDRLLGAICSKCRSSSHPSSSRRGYATFRDFWTVRYENIYRRWDLAF